MTKRKAKTKVVLPAAAKKPRANKSPPWPTYEAWTTSKFFSFIRSGLRSTYNKWPPKWEVLKQAKREYKGPNKRQRYEYSCSECKKYYTQKEISVDHIIPAGSLNSFDDLPLFVERLFVGQEGLQVLCTACHQKKTNKERADKKELKND